MRIKIFGNVRKRFILVVSAILLLGGCSKMSETIEDRSVGMNGSFEYVESDLPVNWIFYTPNTIPSGDYDLIIDPTEPKLGQQSLKFLVRECSPDGGWHSPGFSQQYPAKPGESYKISLWVKNDGCQFLVRIGGVSTKGGKYDTIVNTTENFREWKQFEYEYIVPSEFSQLRLEISILQPGTFWIDHIEIEGIK